MALLLLAARWNCGRRHIRIESLGVCLCNYKYIIQQPGAHARLLLRRCRFCTARPPPPSSDANGQLQLCGWGGAPGIALPASPRRSCPDMALLMPCYKGGLSSQRGCVWLGEQQHVRGCCQKPTASQVSVRNERLSTHKAWHRAGKTAAAALACCPLN